MTLLRGLLSRQFTCLPVLLSTIRWMGVMAEPTTEDPEYIKKYGSNFADAHGDAVNPVRLLEAENVYDKTSDVWSTTSLNIDNVIPGLKFVSRFTYNLRTNHFKKFNPIRDEVGKPVLSNICKKRLIVLMLGRQRIR